MISAEPDILHVPISNEDYIVILASDGVFDYLNGEEFYDATVEFITNNPAESNHIISWKRKTNNMKLRIVGIEFIHQWKGKSGRLKRQPHTAFNFSETDRTHLEGALCNTYISYFLLTFYLFNFNHLRLFSFHLIPFIIFPLSLKGIYHVSVSTIFCAANV